MVDNRLGADAEILADLRDVTGFVREQSEDTPTVGVPEEIEQLGGVHSPEGSGSV
ncbi:hypothetical protein ACFQL1_05285 [Halomicroarcula sp. GCM10025709]|uniref:hypothetical protein n=1 Tax=Halomicroarcula sp. GCM10025709 TaxID=3252669 RepID=UPI003615752F